MEVNPPQNFSAPPPPANNMDRYRVNQRAGHGQASARAADGAGTAASAASAHADTRTAINCPPSVAAAMTSSGDGPGC